MPKFFKGFYENKLKVSATLILIPLILYWKSFFYAFSPMDEQWLIIAPASMLSKWQSLWTVFGDSIQKIYYRPVFTWSLIFDFHLSELNPMGYHISNLVLHVIAGLLLYNLLTLLLSRPASFFLALLFSVHPALLHAVAWIPGRNDILLCIFTLASLICLIKYEQSRKFSYLLLQMFFFGLALLTKETAIVLPFVFLFLELKYGRLNSRQLLLCLIWLGLIALVVWMRSRVINYFPANNPDYLLSLKKFAIAFIIGIGKAIWPVSQSVTPTLANSLPFLYFGITLLFFFIAFKAGLKDKFLGFFGLFTFFILMAAPVWFGILNTLGEQYEHRVYTPMIGLMIFAGQLNFNFKLKPVKLVLVALLISYTLRAYTRMDVYKNPVTYLEEGISDCPENYIFQSYLGHVLYAQGKFSEALPYVNTAIAKQPGKVQLYTSRAKIYVGLNKKKEAIADFTKAIELSPGKAGVYIDRCVAYRAFNDLGNAMKDLELLKRKFPREVPASVETELTKAWQAQKGAELDRLNAAIASYPANAALYVQRAKYHFDQNMGYEALADLKKACELEPGNKLYKGYYDKLNSTFPH